MNEIEKDFTLKTLVTFKIIPFDDELWRTVFPQLKEQFGIEQINIVESRLYLSAFKHYYDVYVDKALIDKYGMEAVNEMVREKIKEKIDKEMERELGFLNTKNMDEKDKRKTLCESYDDFLERKSLAKDDWEMKCPYKVGDTHYCIQSNGYVFSDRWNGIEADNSYFSQGNIFPTEEAAELEVKRRNLLTRFRAFRNECNGDWEADWTNGFEDKFFISFNIFSDNIDIRSARVVNGFYIFGYFKNKKDCERAIELFGDEIIELYVNNEV